MYYIIGRLMLRKSITGGIILLFLLSSNIPFVSSNEVSSNNIINIDDNNVIIKIHGGLGVTIIVDNNGDIIIPLINLTITLDSPFVFLGYNTSSNFSKIMPGDVLSFWTVVIGFGTLSVIVQIDDLTESRDGFIIGPFVIFPIEK